MQREGLSNEEIAAVFEKWNKGELDSYLIEVYFIVSAWFLQILNL